MNIKNCVMKKSGFCCHTTNNLVSDYIPLVDDKWTCTKECPNEFFKYTPSNIKSDIKDLSKSLFEKKGNIYFFW